MESAGVTRVQQFSRKTDPLLEAHRPLYVDVSGHSFLAIRSLQRTFTAKGYEPHIYVKEAAMPTQLSEGWINQQATYGMLRAAARQHITVVGSFKSLLGEVRNLLEADVRKPKEPTEVDRLKVQQKQQDLMLKTQQNNDLLQAKERELEKKTREKQQKLVQPKKPRADGV